MTDSTSTGRATPFDGAGNVTVGTTAIVLGTTGADQLIGTSNADIIYGFAGNDSLRGGAGDSHFVDEERGRGADDQTDGGDVLRVHARRVGDVQVAVELVEQPVVEPHRDRVERAAGHVHLEIGRAHV